MVIAFMNHKGGVGKSLLATHLAVWSVERGQSVILIDADANRQSSKWVERAEAMVHVARLFGAKSALRELRKACDTSERVIIDGAGGDSEVNRILLARADLVLIPCGPSDQELDCTLGMIEVLRSIQETRNGKPDAYLIPNKIVPTHRFSRDFLNLDGHPKLVPFTQTHLRLRAPYAEAYPKRTVTWRLGRAYAEAAAEEMQRLMMEINEYANEKRHRCLA